MNAYNKKVSGSLLRAPETISRIIDMAADTKSLPKIAAKINRAAFVFDALDARSKTNLIGRRSDWPLRSLRKRENTITKSILSLFILERRRPDKMNTKQGPPENGRPRKARSSQTDFSYSNSNENSATSQLGRLIHLYKDVVIQAEMLARSHPMLQVREKHEKLALDVKLRIMQLQEEQSAGGAA